MEATSEVNIASLPSTSMISDDVVCSPADSELNVQIHITIKFLITRLHVNKIEV